MGLNLPQLKIDIGNAYDATLTETDAATAKTNFVNALSLAIDQYVRSGQIVYSAGLIAPSGGGAVTGEFIGAIE